MSDAINYNEIDTEVRDLVRAMNQLPGVATEWSCAGHWDTLAKRTNSIRGFVVFTVDDQHFAAKLNEALERAYLSGFTGSNWNPFAVRGIEAAYARVKFAPVEGRSRFILEMVATPMELQRELIERVTKLIQDMIPPTPAAA